MNDYEEAQLVCALCFTEFAGTAEEQVALFNAHPCESMQQQWVDEFNAAKTRHPAGTYLQHYERKTETAKAAAILIACIVSLAAANWLVEAIAQHSEFVGPLLLAALMAAIVIVCVHNFRKVFFDE